tara:strand:- start:847 stop:1017 length:171 start_codon:yes stop_codon:yes gene_type:complete
MHLEILKTFLLAIFVPVAGYKLYRFLSIFHDLLKPSIREKLNYLYFTEEVEHPNDF